MVNRVMVAANRAPVGAPRPFWMADAGSDEVL